jgi:hypothetical protein
MSAAQEENHVTIDDDVALITEQIEALKELGHYEDVDDDAIYDLSIRWGAALAGRLPRLVHYSRLGQLNEADERRFQSLCDELRAQSELIDRFDLVHPAFTAAPTRKKQRATQLLGFLRRR